MYKCTRCDNWIYDGRHCHCVAFTIIDEDGDDYEVYAIDDHSAALAYAETSNTENEYYLMNETIEITVNGTKFRISAEPDVYYSADEVTDE